jgi:GT2 family glycosyltransferase
MALGYQKRDAFEVFLKKPYNPLLEKVTVAIPSCNAHLLHLCTLSLFRNSQPGFQFLVVTDKPDASMIRLLHAIQRRGGMICVNENLVGAPRAFNQCLRESPTEYVMLMNDDVYIQTDNWLNPLVEALEAHPEFGVVTPSLMLPGVDNGPDFFAALAEASLISKRVIKEVGLFAENDEFRYCCVDADYFLRIHNAGFKMHGIRNSLVLHLPGSTVTPFHSEETFNKAEALLTQWWGEEWKVDQHRIPAYVE